MVNFHKGKWRQLALPTFCFKIANQKPTADVTANVFFFCLESIVLRSIHINTPSYILSKSNIKLVGEY